jgi:phage FluMu protein Com
MENEDLREKVAYLQGLAKGLNVNEASAEGKLLLNIVDILDAVAREIQSVNLAQMDLEEYVEAIDEDLAQLEDEIYEEENGRYASEDEWVEMVCPNCKELVRFDADILEEPDVEVTCPYCRGLVYDNTIEVIEDTSSKHNNPGI